MTMKVLFVAAEGAPFAKTGGLGDVIGSLPKELFRQGVEVRVMLPKYRDIPAFLQREMEKAATLTVPVGWREKACTIERLVYDQIPFYFVANDDYFDRAGCYGYMDDGERYAFFCRAVLEALPHLDFQPNIIHCHDWHTGMISVLLADSYGSQPFYQSVQTVFTIHNLKYQGLFPREILGSLLGLKDSWFNIDGVEFYGQVSFMKGGIAFSDLLTTVSPTYAGEIQHPYLGERLDGLLRKRNGDLFGVINGLDYGDYSPATDPNLYINFNATSLEIKQENKVKLQEEVGLDRVEHPLLAIVSRLAAQKGLDLVAYILEELMQQELQLVVLGTGEHHYEELFRQAAGKYPGKLAACLTYDDSLARKIYAGADILLMPSQFEPCGLSQLIAMRYGTIPIVRETGGLKDTVKPYNHGTQEGNGFSFAGYSPRGLMDTVLEAIELYRHGKAWTRLKKQVMEWDFSWTESAKVYLALYRQLLKRNI
jgi:starch synthase